MVFARHHIWLYRENIITIVNRRTTQPKASPTHEKIAKTGLNGYSNLIYRGLYWTCVTSNFVGFY